LEEKQIEKGQTLLLEAGNIVKIKKEIGGCKTILQIF